MKIGRAMVLGMVLVLSMAVGATALLAQVGDANSPTYQRDTDDNDFDLGWLGLIGLAGLLGLRRREEVSRTVRVPATTTIGH